MSATHHAMNTFAEIRAGLTQALGFIQAVEALVQVPALRQAARMAVRRIIERSDFSQFEASNPYVLRVLRTADWDLALVAMARDSWANRLTPKELRRITAPTLLLWGADDQTIPVTDSVRL